MNEQNPQVPDHRLQEQLQQSQQTIVQLKATIDRLATALNPGQPPAKQSSFKPEVDQAINEKFKELMTEERKQFNNAIGFLTDQNDQLRFKFNYADQKYAEFMPAVEQKFKENIQHGRFVPREEIFKLLYFDKKGVQVAPGKQTAPVPVQPTWDHYTQRFIGPDGKALDPSQTAAVTPLEPAAVTADPGKAPTPVLVGGKWVIPDAQAPAAQAATPAVEQAPAAPVQTQQLPPQSVNDSHKAAPKGPLSLELVSDDRTLQEFETRYGDVAF